METSIDERAMNKHFQGACLIPTSDHRQTTRADRFPTRTWTPASWPCIPGTAVTASKSATPGLR